MFFSLHGAGVAAPSPKAARRPASTAPPPPGTGHAAGEAWSDAQDLRLFFDLGRAVAAAPPSALGELLWAHLSKRVPASAFVLYAYSDVDDALVAIYASDPAATGDPMERIPLGERLSGWVAATGQTILNSDARLDLDAAVRDESPLRSALAARIEAHGRTSGVLSFYAAAPNAFDERNKRLVEAAARVIADTKLTSAASRNDARMSQNRAATVMSMRATVR
jgi:GAF domain-containing protein